MNSSSVSRRSLLKGLAASSALSGVSFAQALPTGAALDFVVVGAGVFGAWTAWNLQRKGHKVLLLDAWGAAHSRASSGGETRLIRTEYAGNAFYTGWAWESLAEWQALSQRHESPIFHQVGALYIYPKDVPNIGASIAVQRALGIPIEKLAAPEMAKRWPQINFDGIAVGVLQPTMGALMARRSVQTLVGEFVKAGGRFRQFAVDPPRSNGALLDIITGTVGETLRADRFIFACGPWLPKLFPDAIGARITPTRQDVFFFAPAAGDSRFDGPHLPAWVDLSSPDYHYGFPDIESRGFKIALDAHGPKIDPDNNDRREAQAQARRSVPGNPSTSSCAHWKSAISYSGRISISLGPSMGLGQRFTQATASSMSLTSQSQKPATSSRVAAKGPLMTVRPGPLNAIRLPWDEGLSPSAARMRPAARNSSLYLPIASSNSAVGRVPFSLSSVAFTNTMTRIVCLLF